MALTDMPLTELERYQPDVAEPADFEEFWRHTLADSREADQGYTLTELEGPLTELVVADVTFSGYLGEPIKAWLIRPRDISQPRPAIVEFIGYGGGRGIPGEKLNWAAAGYIHLVMDTRGQGSAWGGGGGATPDPHGSGAAFPGFMTRGIESPHTYYYRRVFSDAVRLVELAATLPGVDPHRIYTTGVSQGGGISLAATSILSFDPSAQATVAAVMPDVPYLCHFERAVERTEAPPITEITRYLSIHRNQAEQVFDTLSYFDGVNFARRIQVPAYFSVALMDPVVLPSTVFAAYHHVPAAQKAIEVYRFNGHEGGQAEQWHRQLAWLNSDSPR